MMIVAGTGHRPDKLGGYSIQSFRKVLDIAYGALKQYKPGKVISGMALGWDMALAQAAVSLNIPLYAYIPFAGQERVWPSSNQLYYRALLEQAVEVKVCSPGNFSKVAMQKRNELMVDDCDLLLALWNGSSGGTKNCLTYAQLVGRPYVNYWPTFLTGEPIPTSPINTTAIATRDWLGPLS